METTRLNFGKTIDRIQFSCIYPDGLEIETID
jgi:hypothetical protein